MHKSGYNPKSPHYSSQISQKLLHKIISETDELVRRSINFFMDHPFVCFLRGPRYQSFRGVA